MLLMNTVVNVNLKNNWEELWKKYFIKKVN